jgi:hypothetical protein
MLVCLSESRGGSSYGKSIFSYCGQRYYERLFLHFRFQSIIFDADAAMVYISTVFKFAESYFKLLI